MTQEDKKSIFKAGYIEGFENGVTDAVIKTEWNEEDDNIFELLQGVIYRNKSIPEDVYLRFNDWLISIKERLSRV